MLFRSEQLLATVAHEATGGDEVRVGGQTVSFRPPYPRVSLRQAVRDSVSNKALAEEVLELVEKG